MEIRDSISVDASGLTLTRDGFLVGEARVSRAGNVQTYLGQELGLTGDAVGRVFGVYRDPDVVFDEKSMMSLAGRPVTRGHPPVSVTADNWKTFSIGQVGGVIKRDGDHVVAPMAIMDASAAKEVAEGARFLSAGYTVGITQDEGVAPDGTPYQYRQSGDLRFNHVAYLPDSNPRAGNTRIGDGASTWGASPITQSSTKGDRMSDALKTVVLGDKAAQVAAADVHLVDAYKAQMDQKLADAVAEHESVVATKDAAIAKAEAERDAALARVLDDAALDARVQERAKLIADAKAIVPTLDAAGKSDAEIRKAVVAAELGDGAIAGKSDAYIDARFDILVEDAARDPVRKVAGALRVSANDADTAYGEMVSNLSEAWKGAANRKEAV